ncbi:F-box domain-containing protein [Mycena indigotica]|uniref:F-box domain-containing protein n=1 Tax=Mycena indigotica TaxID=2126181 RepID=A0A8H6W7F6_9AGAR|nr:F-box domain-containing protein [Mycena indigotica]KAF7302049.1 F-box domain-containing protein [Mycena indigotica]
MLLLEHLPTDVLLHICSQLPLQSIFFLRQVCRITRAVTQDRSLWINIVQQLELVDNSSHFPPQLRAYRIMNLSTIKALVWRTHRLADKWASDDMAPSKTVTFGLPQSITWLRLVASRWLFVASSDNYVSIIACWDILSLFDGDLSTIALAYLPGRVQTGHLEIQGSQIVIALGLGPETSSVHVVAFERTSENDFSFTELARFNNSSHVLLLLGSLIGCALHNGDNIPHFIDWRTRKLIPIPEPPGGLNVRDRRSVPHGIFRLEDLVVIARTTLLDVYSIQESTLHYLKTIRTSTIWEVVDCRPTSHVLRLVIISPEGVEILDFEHQTLASSAEDVTNWTQRCVAKIPPHEEDGHRRMVAPWYSLRVASNGTRASWVSVASGSARFASPYFVSATLPLPDDLESSTNSSFWSPGAAMDPALWAVPVIDMDESLGLTVFGNCFGELAVYDHCSQPLSMCFDPNDLMLNVSRETVSPSPLNTLITLNIPFAPQRGMSDEELQCSTARWSKDDIHLARPYWQDDWVALDYFDQRLWSGNPCDWAWILAHAFGFPGEVIPQGYGDNYVECTQTLLFRVGSQYFVHSTDGDFAIHVPQQFSDGRLFFPSLLRPLQDVPCTSRTMLTQSMVYHTFSRECWPDSVTPRNRWYEMCIRGGCVDWENLPKSTVYPDVTQLVWP